MYACICTAVTVDDVERAIDRGASSVDEVGASTTAGTTCGSCHDTLDDLIRDHCGPCPLSRLAVA